MVQVGGIPVYTQLVKVCMVTNYKESVSSIASSLILNILAAKMFANANY